jgi:hypothetical protein
LHSNDGEKPRLQEKIMNLERDRQPRWATRLEAMTYARMGATRFNELMQDRKIVAKKNGGKVVVDLNSIDDLYASLPDVAD